MAYRIVDSTPASDVNTSRKPPAPAAGPPTASPRRRAMQGMIVGVALLVAGGLAFGAHQAWREAQKTPSLPLPLPDPEAMRAEMEGLTPEQRREKMREHMTQRRQQMEALTPEERQVMRDAMRRQGEERMQKQVADYFAMDAEDRLAFLDRQLDAMQNRRGPGGPPPDGQRPPRAEGQRPPREGNAEGAAGENRPRRGPPTQEQRNSFMRERLESTDPVDRAKQERYFADLRARAAERGIEMRGGPGGGGRRGR